uniref:Uncharacterized protein n=1 Tax=Anguilla anguilla TaxID=7936 RepID=A0A0E9RE80_ANGAN
MLGTKTEDQWLNRSRERGVVKALANEGRYSTADPQGDELPQW